MNPGSEPNQLGNKKLGEKKKVEKKVKRSEVIDK